MMKANEMTNGELASRIGTEAARDEVMFGDTKGRELFAEICAEAAARLRKIDTYATINERQDVDNAKLRAELKRCIGFFGTVLPQGGSVRTAAIANCTRLVLSKCRKENELSKKKRVVFFFRREPHLTTLRDKVIAKAYQSFGYKVCVKKLVSGIANDDYRWKWFDGFGDYSAPELRENGG